MKYLNSNENHFLNKILVFFLVATLLVVKINGLNYESVIIGLILMLIYIFIKINLIIKKRRNIISEIEDEKIYENIKKDFENKNTL